MESGQEQCPRQETNIHNVPHPINSIPFGNFHFNFEFRYSSCKYSDEGYEGYTHAIDPWKKREREVVGAGDYIVSNRLASFLKIQFSVKLITLIGTFSIEKSHGILIYPISIWFLLFDFKTRKKNGLFSYSIYLQI